jgi:hypothetical protein
MSLWTVGVDYSNPPWGVKTMPTKFPPSINMQGQANLIVQQREFQQGEKPMARLKGDGFIIIAAPENYDFPEYESLEDAQVAAGSLAHRHGSAVIYAPLGVVRPKFDVVMTVSKKVQQIDKQLGTGKVDEPPDAA